MEQIYQIYDRIFKRIFSLSDLSIINLINGLFGTNYPPDSVVTYPNKEFVKRNLQRKFADMFVLINDDPYHLEAQMTEDKTIVVRVFEYCFLNAIESQKDMKVLRFPKPIVIYLDDGENTSRIPETSTLMLDLGNHEMIPFEVTNFKYQSHDIRELNQKKMIILIPFQLLKLRSLIQNNPTKESFEMLKNLIENDIMESIKANFRVGNITEDDANQLKELTRELYEHIYAHYEKLGGFLDMKPLLDGAIELPLDKYRIQIDEMKEEKIRLQKEIELAESEKEKAESEKAKAESEKAKAEEEIKKLKERIKELECK